MPDPHLRYPGQRSAPQVLVAGRRYYIEALSVDTTNSDFLDVGVVLPTGEALLPMPVRGFLSLPSPLVPDTTASGRNQGSPNRRVLEEDPGLLAFYRDFDLFRGYDVGEAMVQAAIAEDFNQSVFSVQKQFIAALEFKPHRDGELLPYPEFEIRMRGGLLPSTRRSTVDIGAFYGSYTWYRYYYSGFTFLQDLVANALQPEPPARGSVGGIEAGYSTATLVNKLPTPYYMSDMFVLVLRHVMPVFMVLAWICTVVLSVSMIVDDRESKVDEALLLMGLQPWIGVLAHNISLWAFMLAPCVALTLELKLGAVFAASDPVVIFMLLFVYAAASIAFAIAFAGLFGSAKTAATATGIVYICMFLPFGVIQSQADAMSAGTKFFLCLSPPTAFGVAIGYVAGHEQAGHGLQWSNLRLGLGSCDNFSAGQCLAALLVDVLLFNVLALLPRYADVLTARWWRWPSGAAGRGRFNEAEGIVLDRVNKTFVSRGWSLRRREASVLHRLSLQIEPGSITALLGLNGVGKSTTIGLLTGIGRPSSGSVTVMGVDAYTDRQRIRAATGYCSQHNVCIPSLTGREHARLAGRVRGIDAGQLDLQLADLAGAVSLSQVDLDRWASTYSGGMLRKLNLILAFIGNPRFIILDEPCAGMDPNARKDTWQFLRQHGEGKTILLSTHHMDEADGLADRVAILTAGDGGAVLKCEGTPSELRSRVAFKYSLQVFAVDDRLFDDLVRLLRTADPAARLKERGPKSLSMLLHPGWLHGRAAVLDRLDELRGTGGISGYEIHSISLQDTFLHLAMSDDWLPKQPPRGQGTAADPRVVDGSGGRGARPTEVWLGLGGTTADDLAEDDSAELLSFADGTPEPPAVAAGHATSTGTAAWMTLPPGCKTVLRKRWLIFRRDPHAPLSQLVLPLVLVVVALLVQLNLGPESAELPLPLDPTLYEDTCVDSQNEIPYRCTVDDQATCAEFGMDIEAGLWRSQFVNVTASFSPSCARWGTTMTSYALCTGAVRDNRHGATGLLKERGGPLDRLNVLRLQRWLARGYANQPPAGGGHATAWFDSTDAHSLPAFLAMAGNAGFAAANGTRVRTVSFPLQKNAVQLLVDHRAQPIGQAVALFLAIASTFAPASNAAFYVRERVSFFKHLQLAAGLARILYWAANLLWDLAVYGVTLAMIAVAIAVADVPVLSGGNRTAVVMLLVAHCWAVTPAAAVLSHLFRSPTNAYVAMLVFTTFSTAICVFAEFLLVLLHTVDGNLDSSAAEQIQGLTLVLPGYCLADGIVRLADEHYAALFAMQEAQANGGSAGPRPDGTAWDVAGANIFTLFVQGAVCWALILTADVLWQILRRAVLQAPQVSDKLRSGLSIQAVDGRLAAGGERDAGFGVADETARIEASLASISTDAETDGEAEADTEHTVLVVGLCKSFWSLRTLWQRHVRGVPAQRAVRGITFGVQARSCFGLLGANGAGKTTTFRCITGDEGRFDGDVRIVGRDVKVDPAQTRTLCGYCPQFGGLCDFLTVTETLQLFAELLQQHRGLDVRHTIASRIEAMQLAGHAGTRVGECSHGIRRKLSVAVAMLGDPAVLFLDEPTAGMDPAGRHFMWAQINAAKVRGTSIMLTSHSMDECERLCDRVGILVAGRFRCIGAPHALREQFGRGFTLRQRLADPGGPDVEGALRAAMAAVLPGATCGVTRSGWLHAVVPIERVACAGSGAPRSEIDARTLVEGGTAVTFRRVIHAAEVLERRGLTSGFDIAATSLDEVFCNFVSTETDDAAATAAAEDPGAPSDATGQVARFDGGSSEMLEMEVRSHGVAGHASDRGRETDFVPLLSSGL